jgi:thioredoxin 1
MITLTTENFEERALRGDKPVLVDFWTEWCPPCRMIAPVLAEIEAEHGDRLTIAKINGDEHPEITSRYDVLGFPTLILFRNGEIVQRIVGARSKRRLLADLNDHL